MGKAHFYGARGRLPPLFDFDFKDFNDFDFQTNKNKKRRMSL
jgi:hypothetical protein